MRPYYAVSKRIIFIKNMYRDNFVLERNWYCANVFGCRKTGWRDPTGFLNSFYLISDILIFDGLSYRYMISLLVVIDYLVCSIIGPRFWDFKMIFKVIFENILYFWN